ncbi:MAG: hypothetical protein LBL72_06225 [Candidatus Accumulibacter sp.]|jgi:hypothetical protein|nr:hypothetical protein [Accumulibacter sp.]
MKNLTVSILLVLLAGCASVAVTDDALVENTSRALGLPPSAFTISDRKDSGVKTTYTAKTRRGKTYSCFVTGTLSVVGRAVSEAMCDEIVGGRSGASSATRKPAVKECNDLLKAAGRC